MRAAEHTEILALGEAAEGYGDNVIHIEEVRGGISRER